MTAATARDQVRTLRFGLLAGFVSVALAAAGCSSPHAIREAEPRRIIAIAPNIVEIVFELGQGERLVAVGDHCEWPPEAARKPRVGGLLDPHLEEIARLEPDLAILLPSESLLAKALERLGVEIFVTPVETLADVEAAVEAIADRLGQPARGAAMIERLREGLTPQPVAQGVSVLMAVGREAGNLADVYAAGSDTFLDELLGRLGGVNTVSDAPLRYPQVGLEEISVRRPEVIVELQPGALTDSVRKALTSDWKRDLPGIDACVVVVEGDYVLVPGPRVTQLYADLAEALAGCRGPA